MTQKCTYCHQHCDKCDGGTINECTECSGVPQASGPCATSCDPNCYTCSTPTNCLSCRYGMYLEGTTCVATCPSNKAGVSGICQLCSTSCLTCSNVGTTKCLTCPPGRFFFLSTCYLICPAGFYGDVPSGDCKQCHNDCFTCTGALATECTGCKIGQYLKGNLCFYECNPIGEFGDMTNWTCGTCDGSCLQCNGPTASDCTSCSPGTFLHLN